MRYPLKKQSPSFISPRVASTFTYSKLYLGGYINEFHGRLTPV